MLEGAQVSGEQLIPAEGIQRREAILFVVAVVETLSSCRPSDGMVGGVKVENQFRAKGGSLPWKNWR